MRVAECVLSESDPSLDLPEDQQWAAAVYGKVREHSSALRTGVCETLVMVGSRNFLFRRRLGIDIEACVTSLVERLLTPLTGETLRSTTGTFRVMRRLPLMPSSLDEDLTGPQPSVLELLACECGRVRVSVANGATVVARAFGVESAKSRARCGHPRPLVGNEDRRLLDSLSAIFRSWIPQTAASLDDRVKAGTTPVGASLTSVGDSASSKSKAVQISHYSGRPHWRNDAAGAGQPVARSEHSAFVRRALDLARHHTLKRHLAT